nr:MAG TPA: hypothetical protein [Caudoviricetes sp.]
MFPLLSLNHVNIIPNLGRFVNSFFQFSLDLVSDSHYNIVDRR